MSKLFWIGIGIVIGVIGLWALSKFYCFKNSEEWKKFKNDYSLRWKK